MAVQTSYGTSMTAAIEGALADNGPHDVVTRYNEEASAKIPFGRGVKFGANDNGALLPAAETDKVVGIVLHTDQYTTGSDGELTSTGLIPDAMMSVLRKGRVWVTAEDGCAPGDRLWVRCTAGGAGEVVGGLNNADEGTETIDCTAQGVWLTTAAAGELAILEVDFTNKP